MANQRLDQIGKTFSSGVLALDDVSWSVPAGECIALVGPSGCGKTTLLRIIAGLEREHVGQVFIDDVDVTDVPPYRRSVAMLFQNPAFHVNQSVRQNLRQAWSISEPLAPLKRWFGGERPREAELTRVAEILGLSNELECPMHQLSGGQQQRVALGRCLLREAKITLLDEPLAHLDAPMRVEMRRQIRRLAREFGLTVIHVTHDPAEALAIGDRVAVLHHGRLLQMDEPGQLRRCPTHQFVVEMIHHETGGLNWLSGQISKDGHDSTFENPLGRWPVSLETVGHLKEGLYRGKSSQTDITASGPISGSQNNEIPAPKNEKVDMMMGIAAVHIRCTTDLGHADDRIRLVGTVDQIETYAGGRWVISICAGSPLRWIGRADDGERLERGQKIAMLFSMDKAYWIDASNGRVFFAPNT